MTMFLKSIFGFAAVVTCFLQLTCASNAQDAGKIQGPCRIEGGQSGITTWRWDIYMHPGERCWQQFGPIVIGTQQRGEGRCGILKTTGDVIGWEYTAGPQPCIDNFALDLVVGAEQKIITFEYTINIAP
jgi:hypothetical protein